MKKIMIIFSFAIICIGLAVVFNNTLLVSTEPTTIKSDETETANYPPPSFNASRILEQSSDLGEFCENVDFSAQGSSWMSYEQKGKATVKYSIGVAARKLIEKIIIRNYGKKAEIRQSATDEALVFESSLYGIKGMATTHLCNDGYLYITCGEVTRGFNIGTDAYNEFMEEFSNCSCIWTPEHPVTIG